MPSYRQCRLVAVLCGVGGASWGTAASAFQFPPLSDDINMRQIHSADAWIGGGFQSSGDFNQSPSEFGPAQGMWQRSPDGNPASGDSFPLMTPGSLPGGLSPNGFNSSGMFPPVNQPPYIANNPAFGGNGQQAFDQNGLPIGQARNANGSNPNGVNPTGANTPATNTPATKTAARIKPKVSWALDATHQPFAGLLGQVARPGVYEIERKGTVLADLLQSIGGLAKDASGQFRIIRNGRPGQMTSYSGAAQFELMPGDLIVADARPSQLGQRATAAKQAPGESVQIGFVNLIDRPVVLKLKSEHGSVSEILSIMRQDQALAAQIKIIAPSSQRGQAQPGPESTLASETVLIFPPNAVKTERLAMLPEPYMLKREADLPSQPRDSKQPSDSGQPYAPQGNVSPDVTQAPRSRPSVGAWSDSTPLPHSSQPISRPSVSAPQEYAEAPLPPAEVNATPKRNGGVRGTPRRPSNDHDQVARDPQMPLVPPAEASTPSPRDVLSSDEIQDNAPVPPSLLKDHGPRRHVSAARHDDADDAQLTAADVNDAEEAADKASSGWSIWPPILTAGIGLLALIGFSVSLRRRTQAATSSSPMATTTMTPTQSVVRTPQPSPRRDLLDAITDNQLPLTEERVPFASPMQFHGRPQPPKNIRMDQRHPLPKPHAPAVTEVRGQGSRVGGQGTEVRDQEPIVEKTQTFAVPRTAATVTQRFRVDRNAANGTGAATSTMTKPAPHQAPSGSLDRALSAVQKQSMQKQSIQKREERDA